MIVTYPIQIPYTAGKHNRVLPDNAYACSEVVSGTYPIGKNRFWHGGVHMTPQDPSVPIRAIADGEVVAYRYDDLDTVDVFFDKTPYSRSFVLLKHETEFGQTTLGTSKLQFYSLYMHLQAWSKVKCKSGDHEVNFLKKIVPERPKLDKNGQPLLDKNKKTILAKASVEAAAPTADGQCHDGNGYARVKRGDILGYSGFIPDNFTAPSRGIHFEIFFDDVTFLKNPIKTIWGRCLLTTELTAYDELPETNTLNVDPSKPLKVSNNDGGGGYQCIVIDKQKYWVSDGQMNIVTPDMPSSKSKPGAAPPAKQYTAKDSSLQAYKKDPKKNEHRLNIGTSIIPWTDPWLKPAEFLQQSFGGKEWIQIYVPETKTFIGLKSRRYSTVAMQTGLASNFSRNMESTVTTVS
jgi:hypothetical protein